MRSSGGQHRHLFRISNDKPDGIYHFASIINLDANVTTNRTTTKEYFVRTSVFAILRRSSGGCFQQARPSTRWWPHTITLFGKWLKIILSFDKLWHNTISMQMILWHLRCLLMMFYGRLRSRLFTWPLEAVADSGFQHQYLTGDLEDRHWNTHNLTDSHCNGATNGFQEFSVCY